MRILILLLVLSILLGYANRPSVPTAQSFIADAILTRPDVIKSIADIYTDTFVKHLPYETALLVRKDSTDFTSGVRGDVFFPFDTGILYIIHTHPDAGFEKPSQQDMRTAIKLKIPIYVVSLHQTWVVDPDGTVRQVL